MVSFECEDKDIEKALVDMHQQMEQCGAFFDPDLVIGERNGDFVVKAPAGLDDTRKILALPTACLPPTDHFKFSLQGDDIVIDDVDVDVSDSQKDLMERMMALYNLTGKIATHRKTNTWQLYNDGSEVVDWLFEGRSKDTIPFFKKIDKSQPEKFVLDSFLKTRVLGMKASLFYDAEPKPKNQTGDIVRILMPVVDFLNHHPHSLGFIVDQGKGNEASQQDALMVKRGAMIEDSDECFVRYGNHDAFDALLHYNYVEPNSFFVRSVPLDIKVPGLGRFVINSNSGHTVIAKEELHENLQDLGVYLPQIDANEQTRTVTFSYIMIPQGGAPRSMRRVLAIGIGALAKGCTREQMMEYLDFIQEAVIQGNLDYYDRLEKRLKSYKVAPSQEIIVQNIFDMIAIQRQKILSYPLIGMTYKDINKAAAS